MKGFATEALILFPTLESWDNEVDGYKMCFNTALRALNGYMSEMGIRLYAFYTDDYARLMYPNAKYIQTLNTLEKFFCLNNVEGMQNIMNQDALYDEERHAQLCKKMISQDMPIEEQFEIIQKNDKAMCNSYIKEFKVVIEFATAGKSRYNLNTSRIKPGHLHFIVKPGTFTVTTYIGPNEEDVITVLGKKYASLPMTEWEALC